MSQEDMLEGEEDDSPVPEEDHKESIAFLKDDIHMANDWISRNQKMPMKGRAVKTQIMNPVDRQSAPI